MTLAVSLIIPVHNGARYIRETLESALNQSCLPAEILVVDDASTDDTVSIVKNVSKHIRIVAIAKSGADAARNEGVRCAEGDLIAFADADDCLAKDRIFLQSQSFKETADLDFVFTHLQEFLKTQPAHGGNPLLEPAKPGICAGTLMARKESFLRAGFFETRWILAGFMEWYFRVIDGGFHTAMLEEVLLYRRIHDDNLTLREKTGMAREYAEVISLRNKRRNKSD